MKQVRKPAKLQEKLVDSIAVNKLNFFLGIIIAVFAFILYAQSISYNYALDDTAVLKKNNLVHKGFSGIPELLKKSYWYGFCGIDDPIYRPASLVLFAIEWQFFPDNPNVYHFFSVLLYAVSCWFLFHLLCKFFKNQNMLFPFVCGILYAAHPIHTEVVDNIKSMDEILCFIFAISSILLFIKWLSNNSIAILILALFSYFMSLVSKETGIIFLILIPLTLFVFVSNDKKKIIQVSLLIVGITVLYIITRLSILVNTATEGHLGIMDNSLIGVDNSMNYYTSAIYILFKYILLLIVPHPLSYDYSFAQVPLKTLGDPISLFSILLYLFLGIYAIIKIKNKNVFAYAILFYLISIFPVSNLYLKLASTMAERFLYIPSLGYCIIVTLFLLKLTKSDMKIKFTTLTQMVSKNTILFVLVFIIAGLYSVKILSRNPNWKNNTILFAHDAEVSDNSAKSHYNYGCVLLDDLYNNESNPSLKSGILDHAIIELNRAISIYPNYPEVYSFLSSAYIKKEDFKNALFYQEKYSQLNNSTDPSIHKNLGYLYEKNKLFDKALAEYDTVLKYEPEFSSAYISKGEIYGLKNMFDESNNEFLKIIKINPKLVTPYIDIGVNYGSAKMYEKALEYFKKAEAIDPNSEDNCRMMGVTYQSLGDQIKAKEYLNKAEQLHNMRKK
jgi:tetratricopeptide (TPR) repeat protein